MTIGYVLAYRLGIAPWERAGEEAGEQFGGLLDREEVRTPPGRALDLGCGRGAHSVELARRGWEVTGVDVVPRALAAARERAAGAGQQVTFLEADVTALPESVGRGYDFVLDVGCFHGLTTSQRALLGRGIERVTGVGATMLALCFAPGGRGPLPRGAAAADLTAAYRGWSVVDEEPAETAGMPAPLRRRAPVFYRLRRDA